MRVYYARPVNIYGTNQEQRDLDLLKSLGFEVNDPNKAELVERYKTEGMEVYLELVRNSDAVAFRATPDGRITAGVQKEIDVAIEARKPVIELPTFTDNRTMSVPDTRRYLQYVGAR